MFLYRRIWSHKRSGKRNRQTVKAGWVICKGRILILSSIYFLKYHNINILFVNNYFAENTQFFIQAMKELGAIPFCITNIPQTMLSYACSNPVYGCTTNPHDSQRTPGGSSGGEACLIAQGGSILGLGSDVGGSLRIPAHFCGITALKPTQGRLCERGRGQVDVLLENCISQLY